MVKVLGEFAAAHADEELYLFGCTDDYAAMIIRSRAMLPMYIAPSPDASIYESIQKKAEFYEVCEKYGIPYPKTTVLASAVPAGMLNESVLGFSYPVVIKPSSSVEYWKFPFKGMKKVYISKSPEQSEEIIKTIYASGYSDKMIVQEFIPGGDSSMRVLTAFSDSRGKVRGMCLGHTMVEEHTPKGLGNHAAIVTEDVTALPVAADIKRMLEDIGYTGFSNFDLKYTGHGSDFRVFEINLRQGRSNYYVTAAGMNIAKMAVEKYNDGGDDCLMVKESTFWHHVPAGVAYKYTEDAELVKRAKELKRQGKSSSSLLYGPDLSTNPLRLICVLEHLRRHYKKYKIYYPKSSEGGK
jgi:D-aspartate ligase